MASPSDAYGRIAPFETGRTTGLLTANSTSYTRIDLSFAGQACIVLVPDAVQLRTDVTLVQHSHGVADDRTHVVSARMKTTTDGMLDRGWVVTSHDMHGNNWGSEQAMGDLRDVYHWAAQQWHVKRVVLHGFSMGGYTTYVALGGKIVPDIAATITVNGVVDGFTSWASDLRGIYGGMSDVETQGYMVGHDPARDDPQRWAGDPIFMIGGTGDSVVPPAQHMDVFLARAATPAAIHYELGTHGHLAGFLPELALPWADAYAPTYTTQTPYGAPVPNWPQDPPPETPPSGLYRTNGAEVSLYDTSGQSATIN